MFNLQGSKPKNVEPEQLAAMQRSLEVSQNQIMARVEHRQYLTEVTQIAQAAHDQPPEAFQAPTGAVGSGSAFIPESLKDSYETCRDNTDWVDPVHGSATCASWSGNDCNDPFSGYSSPDVVNANCPATCGICTLEHITETDSAGRTFHKLFTGPYLFTAPGTKYVSFSEYSARLVCLS